jgi:deoxyribonuclease-4
MLPDGRRLGAHLPLGAGMVKAVDRAAEIGATALQVFTDNPTAWARRAEPPTELPAFRDRLAAAGIEPVVSHASYLVNLAGPEPRFYDQSVGLLAQELVAAPAFGVRYVNVHIGSHRGAGVEAGIERLAHGVAATFARADELAMVAAEGADDAPVDGPGPVLVLENSAGAGWGLGTSLEELGAIAAAIAGAGVDPARVAFCLDVAHAWGAGIDMGDPDAIDAFLGAFDRGIGLERLVLVHLNDSRAECGSRLDRHEHVGAGRVGERGMAHLLRHPRLAHATYIVETPGMDEGYDAINLARAEALAWGRPLAALPEGAFELRGSRARTAPA